MTVLANLLTTNAIHWARSEAGEYGQPSYASPVALLCRWENKTVVVLNAQMERREATAVVYVASDVAETDRLALGTWLTSTPADPNDVDGAREVVAFERSDPALLNVDPVRKAYVR